MESDPGPATVDRAELNDPERAFVCLSRHRERVTLPGGPMCGGGVGSAGGTSPLEIAARRSPAFRSSTRERVPHAGLACLASLAAAFLSPPRLWNQVRGTL